MWKSAVCIFEGRSICYHNSIAIVLNSSCSIWHELPAGRGRIWYLYIASWETQNTR